jgi:hypothetical protein
MKVHPFCLSHDSLRFDQSLLLHIQAPWQKFVYIYRQYMLWWQQVFQRFLIFQQVQEICFLIF